MTRSLVTPAGLRDGEPLVIAQGILDGDGIVYELFPMQTVQLDGQASAIQSIPFPIFDTAEYRKATLSLMLRSRTGFVGGTTQLRLRLQNAIQSADDPSTTFAADAAFVSINSGTPVPGLVTTSFTGIGPGARLRMEWSQGTTTSTSSATFALWLTLRSA